MLNDGRVKIWNEVTRNRIDSKYTNYGYSERYMCHVWRETYERGYTELVITEEWNGYDSMLTATCYTGVHRVALREQAGRTFDKDPDVSPTTAVRRILSNLYENRWAPFEEVLDSAWELWTTY